MLYEAMPDDTELLRQYSEIGDNEAFAAFVKGRIDLVYSVAVRRVGGDTHLAKDVAQRVFCAAAQRASVIARHPYPTAWLYETTRLTALSFMRAERRRKLMERIQGKERQLNPGSEPPWERLAPFLDEAIDKLGAGDRAAVLLRFFDGLTFPEIASRLKLTDSGARLRVNRAMGKLRRVLARKGIASTSAGLAVVLESQAVGAAPAGLASTLSTSALSAIGTATTGSGGAAAAKMLLFMSTTKAIITTSLIGILAAFMIGLGVHESRSASLAESRLALAERMYRELSDRVDSAKNNSQRSALLQAALSKIKNEKPSGMDSEIAGPNASEAPQIRHDLNLTAAWLGYAPFFRQLGLTPEQVDRWFAIEDESWGKIDDIAAAAKSLGISEQDPIVQQLENQEKTEMVKAKRDLIGDAGWEQFQQWIDKDGLGSFPGSAVVFPINSALVDTGSSPLTFQQGAQLAQIVYDQHIGGNNIYPPYVDRDWDAITAQSAPFLDSNQAVALRNISQEWKYFSALTRAEKAAP
jgi:RNA polymerase sigma factor (sigma-70 family)